jgi:hypothetical protein
MLVGAGQREPALNRAGSPAAEAGSLTISPTGSKSLGCMCNNPKSYDGVTRLGSNLTL